MQIRRTAIVAAVAALAVTACSASDDDSAATARDEQAAFEEPAADAGGDTAGGGVGDEAAAEAPAELEADGVGTGSIGFDLGAIGRDVVVEMSIAMRADDLGDAVAGITRAAATAGGGVAQTDVDYAEPPTPPEGQPADPTDSADPVPATRYGWARLVVKVPPESVADVVSGLDRYGEVTSIAQSAQDVTEQVIDLEVRIANAERSVARVRELLDAATDVRAVIEIEAELTRRQIDLERLLASQRNLAERVALATLTIEVTSSPSAMVDPVDVEDDDGIGDAFARGWDAFVGVLFGLGFVLAVAAPFLGVAVLVAVAAWLALRGGRRERAVTRPPADAADDRDELVSASPRE